MEIQSSLLCAQKPNIYPYTQPHNSKRPILIIFAYLQFNLQLLLPTSSMYFCSASNASIRLQTSSRILKLVLGLVLVLALVRTNNVLQIVIYVNTVLSVRKHISADGAYWCS